MQGTQVVISVSTLFSPVTKLAFYTKEGVRYFFGDLKRGGIGVKNYIAKNRGIDAQPTTEEQQ